MQEGIGKRIFMDVVYAPGDNYAVYTGVSIYSLCAQNRSADNINIYIISNNISAENKEKLTAIAENFERNIFFTDVSEELEEFGKQTDAGSYGINVFGRFFMGKLLSHSIDRLLYIDCDTVINGSLSELFEMDMKGKTVCAVPEPTIYKSVLKSIGFSEAEPYFNAGVLLIDFKKWVSEDVSGRLVDYYKENGKRLFCADQDAINYVLRGETGMLSPEFNFFTNYKYFSYEFLKKESPSYGDIGKAAFERAKSSPRIIHYLGTERPWLRGNLNPYRKIYRKWLELSPYRGQGKIRGREAELLLFHLMEIITVLCPFFRKCISGYFERKYVIPRTGEARK